MVILCLKLCARYSAIYWWRFHGAIQCAARSGEMPLNCTTAAIQLISIFGIMKMIGPKSSSQRFASDCNFCVNILVLRFRVFEYVNLAENLAPEWVVLIHLQIFSNIFFCILLRQFTDDEFMHSM